MPAKISNPPIITLIFKALSRNNTQAMIIMNNGITSFLALFEVLKQSHCTIFIGFSREIKFRNIFALFL